MNKLSNKMPLSAAVAGILGATMAVSPASAGKKEAKTKAPATEHCYGINKCGGHGKCAGEGHACAGKNSCQGQGYLDLPKGVCAEIQGGSLEPVKKG